MYFKSVADTALALRHDETFSDARLAFASFAMRSVERLAQFRDRLALRAGAPHHSSIAGSETRQMTLPDFSKFAPMSTAPRDGTLVLVALHASEQGPAEVDAVRWAQSARSGDEGWVANDSDPFARVVYADQELSGWLPLPTQLPALRSQKQAQQAPQGPDEADGAGI